MASACGMPNISEVRLLMARTALSRSRLTTAGNGLMSKSCSNGLDILLRFFVRRGGTLVPSLRTPCPAVRAYVSCPSLGAVRRNEYLSPFSRSAAPARLRESHIVRRGIARGHAVPRLARGKCRSARQKIVRLRSIFRSKAPRRLVQRKRRETLVAPRLGRLPDLPRSLIPDP